MKMAGQTPRGDNLFNDKQLTPESGPTLSLTHSPSPMLINSPCFLLQNLRKLVPKLAFALKKVHTDFGWGEIYLCSKILYHSLICCLENLPPSLDPIHSPFPDCYPKSFSKFSLLFL